MADRIRVKLISRSGSWQVQLGKIYKAAREVSSRDVERPFRLKKRREIRNLRRRGKSGIGWSKRPLEIRIPTKSLDQGIQDLRRLRLIQSRSTLARMRSSKMRICKLKIMIFKKKCLMSQKIRVIT